MVLFSGSFPSGGVYFFHGGSICTLVVLWCVADAGGALRVRCSCVYVCVCHKDLFQQMASGNIHRCL
jgi:hypothetical protein